MAINDRLGRRQFVGTLGAGLAGTALAGSALTGCEFLGRKRSPNIVIIFTDDQGYGDVGCYGAVGYETPNLDRMASEGMRFTDFHVTTAVCSASRSSLLTGCYNVRLGIHGAYSPTARRGLHPDEVTIAEILKEQDYATAVFGKWHLGSRPQFNPLRYGFDEYFGLLYSNDMWPGNPEVPPDRHPPLPLMGGEEVLRTLEEQSMLTTWYTEHAVQFIRDNRGRPFFLYVPHSMPHIPLYVSDKFRGVSEQGLYGDVMMEIDWSVGQILQTLKEEGLDRHTLVVFTSDNGPWLCYGDYAGSAGPLREGKGTIWEGGIRVPCIMRWPGRIPEGSICDELATTMDILPTVAGLVGGTLPGHKIDGHDIWPLISGKAGASTPYEAFYCYYSGQLRAIRSGRWKLHFPHGYASIVGAEIGQNMRRGRYAQARTGLELYDLDSDIGETTDVAESHPDVVRHLQELAEVAREDLGDNLTDRQGSGVRPVGEVQG